MMCHSYLAEVACITGTKNVEWKRGTTTSRAAKANIAGAVHALCVLRRKIMETAFSIIGFLGFIFALAAYHKADKLEKKLKKRKLIDEKFDGDR